MWAEWVTLTKMLIFKQPNVRVYHSHFKVGLPLIEHIEACDVKWFIEHLE